VHPSAKGKARVPCRAQREFQPCLVCITRTPLSVTCPPVCCAARNHRVGGEGGWRTRGKGTPGDVCQTLLSRPRAHVSFPERRVQPCWLGSSLDMVTFRKQGKERNDTNKTDGLKITILRGTCCAIPETWSLRGERGKTYGRGRMKGGSNGSVESDKENLDFVRRIPLRTPGVQQIKKRDNHHGICRI